MRNNIVHFGADKLKYEIRGILKIAYQLEKTGIKMIWENIGDPIAKGHKLPDWIKEIIMNELEDDLSFGYCPTKGLDQTREFLAKKNNELGGAQITAEDIIFFNGIGDAISTFYHYLRKSTRVLGPSPAYSTHSSAEAAHARAKHLTYDLDPNNDWMPDIDDIYNKVKYNPLISGILLINPDNPTGAVYPREILEKIVDIAREFDIFLVTDEIYMQTTYNGTKHIALAEVIGDLPAVSMKGISKEFPWPGARCGWIEAYNTEKDNVFARFIQTLEDAKMLEVCSTTLPQKVIPEIMSHTNYESYHVERCKFFEKRANEVADVLGDIDGMVVNRANGAFYFSPIFKNGVLNNKQKLPISAEAQKILERPLKGANPDKRLVFYLMANTGICLVPLSEFNSNLQGFRMTLLEADDQVFTKTCKTLKKAIEQYINS